MVADPVMHLALPDDWTAALAAGEYRISTRGRSLDEEGFIHCSFPGQTDFVANRFYADVERLTVLVIDVASLGAPVRVEPAADGVDEQFPHIYGPIPTSAVAATRDWRRDADGVWRSPTG